MAFKQKIYSIVNEFVSKSKGSIFEDNSKEKLCKYVIEELPELLHGFEYKNTYYNCYTYPEDSSLTRFVEKMQKKEMFPELYKEFGVRGNVFVELIIMD